MELIMFDGKAYMKEYNKKYKKYKKYSQELIDRSGNKERRKELVS